MYFHSKFHTLSSSAKIKDRLIFDKVTESLQVETFLRHGVERNRRVKQRQQKLYLNSKAPQCGLLSALQHRLVDLVYKCFVFFFRKPSPNNKINSML